MVNIFCGGNGTSKTTTLVNLVANICWDPNKDWFDYPIFHEWPHLKDIRIISDPTTIADKMVSEMKKWFPRGKYKTFKEKRSYEYRWVTDTGFTITLMSYEQDLKEFESVDLGLVLFDEPPPERIFNASLARLRLGGKAAAFMTPLASAAYIFENFIEGFDEGYHDENRAFYIYADVEDNCKQHGKRGFLEHKHIEQIADLYEEDEKEARLHGRFMGLIGLIYKDFDPRKHVLPDISETALDWVRGTWRVYWAIDQHPVTPTHVMFMAILSNGQKVVIDEIFAGKTIEELTSEIIDKFKKFKKMGGRIARVGLIDASSVIEDKLRGKESVINDFVKAFRKLGYDYTLTKASKDRDRGEDLVKQEFKGTVNPNLYICKMKQVQGKLLGNTLWEIKRYGKNPKDPTKRMDKDDHAMECLYRLVIANLHTLFSSTRDQKRKKLIQGIGNRR